MRLEPRIPNHRWPEFEGFHIIDCDVHTEPGVDLLPFLGDDARRHMTTVGLRSTPRGEPVKLSARPNAIRLDTNPPGGGIGGSDPEFAREQLLDEYGLTAAILSNIKASTGAAPLAYQTDLARGTNDYTAEVWLPSDSRWLTSINTTATDVAWSVAEIHRCADRSERYVQVLMDPHTERPAGNPAYWPIYQAAVERGLPVAFHVSGRNNDRLATGVGGQTFYFETRTSLSAYAKGLVASLIFEGVFDRFPDLRVALIELEWTWVVPMAWRYDATWSVMREDGPQLKRLPSEYLRDHFWFTTQPNFDPEFPEQFYEVYDQFAQAGFSEKLMFSSDYPHWDMDSPFESTPVAWPDVTKDKVLGRNAIDLYGFELAKVAHS